MGQIDSFKKVLGLTDQPAQNPTDAVMKEEKPKVTKHPRKDKGKRKLTATLAVSADTRSAIRNLMYWARSEGLIKDATSEDVLLFMLDSTLEMHPKCKRIVRG